MGKCLAWISLLPIFIFVGFITLILFRRELHTVSEISRGSTNKLDHKLAQTCSGPYTGYLGRYAAACGKFLVEFIAKEKSYVKYVLEDGVRFALHTKRYLEISGYICCLDNIFTWNLPRFLCFDPPAIRSPRSNL